MRYLKRTMRWLIATWSIGLGCFCGVGCSEGGNDLNLADSSQSKGDNSNLDGGGKGQDGGIASDGWATKQDGQLDGNIPPKINWTACDTSVWPVDEGYEAPGPEVECATVPVPVDHSKLTGPTMLIRIARQKSKVFPQGKALFNLAGGPGGGAVWESGISPQIFPNILSAFDLLYVDQRGTGGSDYMDCPQVDPVTGEKYNTTDRKYYEACAQTHAKKDLNHYLTLDAAQDLEWVRKLLGYEKIYFVGVSYGTRLGLEYIRQYPDRVGAAVLDGLVTPDWDMFKFQMQMTGMAVSWLIDDCKRDSECQAVSPTLADDLETRRKALQAKPR